MFSFLQSNYLTKTSAENITAVRKDFIYETVSSIKCLPTANLDFSLKILMVMKSYFLKSFFYL